MQKVKLMLPAYNEELSLAALLKRVESIKNSITPPLEVLVVNDGSKDKTLDVAKSFGVNVLDLQPNRGLAGAMREGIREAIKDMADDDILVTMDADDTHNPELIPAMVSQVKEGFDIIIASRYRKGSKINGLAKYRETLSIGARFIFMSMAPMKGVRDYTCGYRAYKVKLLKQMQEYYGEGLITQKGFGCMAEILLKTRRFKPVIHEVPFILQYDKKMGDSKMNVWKTIAQTVQLILSVNRMK